MRLPMLVATLLSLPLSTVLATSPYEHDGSFAGGPVGGGPLLSDVRSYRVQLDAGEHVVATLTWTDPDAVLHLAAGFPGHQCPVTDAACLAGLVLDVTDPCATVAEGSVLDHPRVLDFVAPVTGQYRIDVSAGLVLQPTDYHLVISIDGAGAGRVTGPLSGGAVSTMLACDAI